MGLAEAPMVILLAGLAAYVVLGGADFGAGFWYVASRGRRGSALREHTYHAMGPVWEANHVWLVFVLVVAWTAYPGAFASIASTLSVPLFVAAVGIILRGTTYALRGHATRPREERVVGAVFGVSSVLTPFALGAAIGGIASGRVPVGNAAGDQWSSWLNPTSVLIGCLAVATSVYLAAVWLAADGARRQRADLAGAFRARALVAGLVSGGIALGGLLVLHADADRIFDGLSEGAGLAAVVASAIAGVATLALVGTRRLEPARYAAALAVAAIVAGWALAQQPQLLPGLTVEDAAAGDATLVALLVGIGAGGLIVVPSLALLFGLVLGGRFDARPDDIGSLAHASGPISSGGERATGRGGAGRASSALASACAAAGVGLTIVADGGAAQAIGVVLLLTAVATACARVLPEVVGQAGSNS